MSKKATIAETPDEDPRGKASDGDTEQPDESDGITLTPTSFKVSATEKRSLGDYENFSPHATIEGEIDAPGDVDRDAIRERLVGWHAMLRGVVQGAADERVEYATREWE